jgi:hypothetical protein
MRDELRTKPSIRDGISSDLTNGGIRAVEYQPGNGSRYSLVLSDLSFMPTTSRAVKPPNGTVLVWCANFGKGWLTENYGSAPVHFTSVREKLGCSITDAVVLAELIGYLLSRPYVSAEDFKKTRVG